MLIRHVIFALGYCALAVAVALTLPYSLPDVSHEVAILAGALVLIFGAVLHEVTMRQDRDTQTDLELRDVRQRLKSITDELDLLRTETATRLDAERTPVAMETVAAEMRMLSQLMEHFPSTRGTFAAFREAEAPALSFESAKADSPALNEQTVLEAVHEALRADRIELHVQPIVSLPQRRVRHFEICPRLHGPAGQALHPEDYTSIATQEGLIGAIDNLLLFRCVQFIREHERDYRNANFFCNVAPATLRDSEFLDQFLTFMALNPALTSRLVLELSQDDLTGFDALPQGIVDGLQRLGFRLSMDNVTHIHIEAEQLARRDVRFVKVPSGLVLDTIRSPAGLEHMMALRDNFDRHAIDLIIEGIETEAQLVELLDLRIDFGQGALFETHD